MTTRNPGKKTSTRALRGFAAIVGAILVMSSLLALAVACGKPDTSADAVKRPNETVAAKSADPWDELVKAAQKEGSVNIYGTSLGPVEADLKNGFMKRYGISLDFTQGRPPEVQAKITAERRAGLYLADVGHLGETTSTLDIKPLGITTPLDNLFVLPEVKDGKNWIGGNLIYLEKDHHVLMFMPMAIPLGIVNTDMVKPGSLSSFTDLLQPQWKGKLVLSDPTVSGAAPNILAALYKGYGKEKAMETFRQLAAQEPMITRDQRVMTEWVAKGKYAVFIGQDMNLYNDFVRAGAPLGALKVKEPKFISGASGTLIVFDQNPHPNATKLYANWVLSKEGSSIWSKAAVRPSARVDVSTEGLDPDTIPTANDIFPDQEHMELRVEMRKAAADIFKDLIK